MFGVTYWHRVNCKFGEVIRFNFICGKKLRVHMLCAFLKHELLSVHLLLMCVCGVCVCVCVCEHARVYLGWQKTISVTVARRNFVRTDGEIPSRASDLWRGGE